MIFLLIVEDQIRLKFLLRYEINKIFYNDERHKQGRFLFLFIYLCFSFSFFFFFFFFFFFCRIYKPNNKPCLYGMATSSLAHCNLESPKRVIGKQCRPRSGSPLFANILTFFFSIGLYGIESLFSQQWVRRELPKNNTIVFLWTPISASCAKSICGSQYQTPLINSRRKK